MHNARARSFIIIMIIIAIAAVSLRFAVKQFIRFNIIQNESAAQSTIKLIATALENYAKDNHGVFPANLSVLTKTNPPYLSRDYLSQSPIKGYSYGCSKLDSTGYSCSAFPLKCNFTGSKIYNFSTGSLFISEECNKRE